MAGNILELITEQYHSLTRSSRKLADYILANTHDSQYMSISTLAESSGVSEASITRFCRSLGLSGYNNLKLALAKAAYVTDIGDPSDTPDTITSEDTLGSIFHKLYASKITIERNITSAFLKFFQQVQRNIKNSGSMS